MVLLILAVLVTGLLSWAIDTTTLPGKVKTFFHVAFVVPSVVLVVRVLEVVGIRVL
jgi:hypothetical protein